MQEHQEVCRTPRVMQEQQGMREHQEIRRSTSRMGPWGMFHGEGFGAVTQMGRDVRQEEAVLLWINGGCVWPG